MHGLPCDQSQPSVSWFCFIRRIIVLRLRVAAWKTRELHYTDQMLHINPVKRTHAGDHRDVWVRYSVFETDHQTTIDSDNLGLSNELISSIRLIPFYSFHNVASHHFLECIMIIVWTFSSIGYIYHCCREVTLVYLEKCPQNFEIDDQESRTVHAQTPTRYDDTLLPCVIFCVWNLTPSSQSEVKPPWAVIHCMHVSLSEPHALASGH